MKKSAVTIRLDAKLQQALDDVSARLGRSRSDVAQEALRRQLALVQLERIRRDVLLPAASRCAWTDEDVFAAVS